MRSRTAAASQGPRNDHTAANRDAYDDGSSNKWRVPRPRYMMMCVVMLVSWVWPRVACGSDGSDEGGGGSRSQHLHVYDPNEVVTVWTDKMGPYHNPHETYPYENLPICELQDAGGIRKEPTIGEALEGHNFISSPRINIKFSVGQPSTDVCSMKLNEEQAEELVRMVEENYWYQIYIDDLPNWGFLGEMVEPDEGKEGADEKDDDEGAAPSVPSIFTHREFVIYRNGPQIISVDMEPSDLVPIKAGAELKFTYSVEWHETDVPFKNRFEKYLEFSFFEHKVHWFSIVNSFMLCLFLCAIVSVILARVLRRDFAKYAASEADELESMDRADESGWKQVHGDVFRKPSHLLTFSVLYSSGCHLMTMIVGVILLAIANSYYTRAGSSSSAAVLVYIVTQSVGGYAGGYTFKLYGGKGWKKAMFAQVLFIPSVVLVIFAFLNTTALVYTSSMAVPAKNIATVVLLFLVLCIPLHTVGTLLGRRHASKAAFPCRIHHLKRPIPPKHWAFLPCMISGAGLIPFGCVFIEMYFLFSSFWGYKFYYVYGFMLAILLLFSCVLVCVSITSVYILLNAEDYRWAWVSFLSCASTGVYVFLYSIYYYHNSTKMRGFLQFMYYFGSTAFFCFCLSLFCGSLGYLGAFRFVSLIYKNIKAE
ncbi:unnamed protein product [Vitrella brassicaformis CCMP3155]|uniref:Transmembrane 9 superfamily member n=2 Tax=Vitrella brassicaformis TaxID=1169539 RepID=A0A0G4EBA6_VITBC|nr:unnamed protein product [Vitrella brassicaformis CCMP3155]|eukprot:CEL92549.1 unnamed protein product [Vitrella brassicaformis CCMP3155]